LDERGHARRDGGLGVGAENQAGEGDADLRGGDIAVERMRVFEDRQDLKLAEATGFDNGVALLRYEVKK